MNPQIKKPHWLGFDPETRHVSIDPRAPAFVQDPYAAYAFLHRHAPVFFWKEYGMWCVAGHDLANRIFRDRRFGRERPGGYLASVGAEGPRPHLADFDRVEASSMLEIEPPVHTRLRTLVNRAFVSRQVERLRPRIEALCHRLIDGFEADRDAELITTYATPVPATVIAEMMGVPVETGTQLVAWSNDMVRMYMHAPTRETEDQANRSAAEFAAFVRAHAEDRRRTPGDDLLSVLVTARDGDQRLSDDELVSSAILLLNAGHEATVHQIGNAVKTLLGTGKEPRGFFASSEMAAATVEECLRIDAPLHMFTRYAYEDVEIGRDVVVARHEQVALLLGAANTDPQAFEDPLAFRPGRPDQKNLSFGAGIHFCIGAPLARLELQVALRVLFERLPGLALSAATRYRDIYHFHGLERLDVTW